MYVQLLFNNMGASRFFSAVSRYVDVGLYVPLGKTG